MNKKLKNIENENKLLKRELQICKKLNEVLEEMKCNLLAKISLMKFQCSQFDLDHLASKYSLIQSNISRLDSRQRVFKDMLASFRSSVYAGQVAGGQVAGGQVAGGQIVAGQVAAGQIVTDQVAAGHIVTGQQMDQDLNNEQVSIANISTDDKSDKQKRKTNPKKRVKQIKKERTKLICKYESCRRRFYKASILEAHHSFHSNGYAYGCEWPGCHQTFNIRSHYIKHRSRHSDQGNYICDWPGCQYRSFESSAIKYHYRVHTNERPFQCSDCSMKFKIKQHLDKHKLKHTGQKPYQCLWLGCDRRFTTISYMRAHYRKIHSH